VNVLKVFSVQQHKISDLSSFSAAQILLLRLLPDLRIHSVYPTALAAEDRLRDGYGAASPTSSARESSLGLGELARYGTRGKAETSSWVYVS
jgi:hypothetical protein